MSRFRVLTGRPSCCRMLVVLMLSLAAAGCADETAQDAVTAPSANVPAKPSDFTAPGPVTGLFVKADSSTDSSVALHWTNPTDADFTGVMIRRALGTTPPATVTDGDLVRDLVDDVPYIVDVGGVDAGTQYSYALFAHDGANNYAPATEVTFTTTKLPPGSTGAGPRIHA